MTEDAFKKLLERQLSTFYGQVARHMDEKIHEVKLELADMKDDIRQVQRTVDGVAQRLDQSDSEDVARDAQLDRHDTWIHQLADNSHLKLSQD